MTITLDDIHAHPTYGICACCGNAADPAVFGMGRDDRGNPVALSFCEECAVDPGPIISCVDNPDELLRYAHRLRAAYLVECFRSQLWQNSEQRLKQKIEHGCTSAFCEECDGADRPY